MTITLNLSKHRVLMLELRERTGRQLSRPSPQLPHPQLIHESSSSFDIIFSKPSKVCLFICEAAIFYAFCIIDFMESENHFLIYFCTDDISDVPIKVPSSFLSHHSQFPFYYTLFSFRSSLYSNLKQRNILTPCGTVGS